MKFTSLKAALAAAALLCTVSTLPLMAQEAGVVATVGGLPITEDEVKMGMAGLDQQYAKLPEEQRRLAAIAALVDVKAVVAKAKAAKLDGTDDFKKRMAFLADRTMHDAYFNAEVVAKITDADLQARYDKEVAATPPQNEIRARHILVKTKEEAVAIIKELDGGAKFEDLAIKHSSDGSAAQGGDLGYFGKGQMVPEFETAAEALPVGGYSKEPVQTQFGFHVLKVEDKRVKQPPAFADVKPQVRDILVRERYVEMVKKFRDELKVDYVDPAVKKAMADAEAASAATAADAPKQ